MSERDEEIEFLRRQIDALEAENRELRCTSSSKTEQRTTEYYRHAYEQLLLSEPSERKK